jgi:predicted patatin/cPLA2 family phospholipase
MNRGGGRAILLCAYLSTQVFLSEVMKKYFRTHEHFFTVNEYITFRKKDFSMSMNLFTAKLHFQ